MSQHPAQLHRGACPGVRQHTVCACMRLCIRGPLGSPPHARHQLSFASKLIPYPTEHTGLRHLEWKASATRTAQRHNRQQQCAKALTCAPRPMCPGVRWGPVEVLGGRVLLRHRCCCRADGHEGLRHTASTNATTGRGAPRVTAPARAGAAWAGGWRRATPSGISQSYGGGPTAQSLARHARGVHGRCGYRRL